MLHGCYELTCYLRESALARIIDLSVVICGAEVSEATALPINDLLSLLFAQTHCKVFTPYKYLRVTATFLVSIFSSYETLYLMDFNLHLLLVFPRISLMLFMVLVCEGFGTSIFRVCF